MGGMKTCTSCKQAKPLTEFGKHAASKGGLRPVCKPCNRLAAKMYREQNPHQKKQWVAENADHVRAYKREWAKSNRAVETERQKRWRQQNRDRVRAGARARWSQKRSEMAEYYRRYRQLFEQKNPGLMRHWVQEYRAAKLRAVPPWASAEKIAEVYERAALWNSIYPDDPVEVDHIVPLRGKNASGLHVETNLRIIRRVHNRKKGNKMEEPA